MSGRVSQQIGASQESKLIYKIVEQLQKNNQDVSTKQASFTIPISKPTGLSSEGNLYYEWLRNIRELSAHLGNCCTTTTTTTLLT